METTPAQKAENLENWKQFSKGVQDYWHTVQSGPALSKGIVIVMSYLDKILVVCLRIIRYCHVLSVLRNLDFLSKYFHPAPFVSILSADSV